MAGEPDIDPPFLCTLFDGLLAQLVRPAANTEGGVCKRAWHASVRVRALSQELYITFVHQTRIKRSVRPWLSLHREQVRGAWGGAGRRAAWRHASADGAPPTVASPRASWLMDGQFSGDIQRTGMERHRAALRDSRALIIINAANKARCDVQQLQQRAPLRREKRAR